MNRIRTLALLAFLLALAVTVFADELDDLRKAAEQGDAGAQLALLRKAAEQGDAGAQLAFGLIYDLNYDLDKGVPEDDREAVKWYRLAAEQGHAAAQLGLGLMYSLGEGVPEDYVQAHLWLNLAAAGGDDNAREARDIAATRMTREQIAEAQRLAREWWEKHQE